LSGLGAFEQGVSAHRVGLARPWGEALQQEHRDQQHGAGGDAGTAATMTREVDAQIRREGGGSHASPGPLEWPDTIPRPRAGLGMFYP
jgi:hypothetical protein